MMVACNVFVFSVSTFMIETFITDAIILGV